MNEYYISKMEQYYDEQTNETIFNLNRKLQKHIEKLREEHKNDKKKYFEEGEKAYNEFFTNFTQKVKLPTYEKINEVLERNGRLDLYAEFNENFYNGLYKKLWQNPLNFELCKDDFLQIYNDGDMHTLVNNFYIIISLFGKDGQSIMKYRLSKYLETIID